MVTKTEEKFKVYMIYETSSTGGAVCSGEEDSDWPSHEDEHVHFTPKGLRLKAPAWSETIEVDFDPKGSEHLYVVVVRYTTGDTFGVSHGHWHVTGAHETYEEAEKVAVSIKKKKYKGTVYWDGHFDTFEGVTVERLDVWK